MNEQDSINKEQKRLHYFLVTFGSQMNGVCENRNFLLLQGNKT